MKKKIFITTVMLLLCLIMTIGIKSLQRNINSGTQQQENNINIASEVPTDQKVETKPEDSEQKEVTKAEEPNKVEEKVEESTSPEKEGNNENKSSNINNSSGGKTPTPTPAATIIPEKPAENPNLIITDTITGKVIKKTASFNGNKLFYDILKETLDSAKKSGEISGFSIDSFGYVKMINGAWEKKPQASSGWIYYVNGKKVDFGIKDERARFSSGTVVEFKFYRDALNEK